MRQAEDGDFVFVWFTVPRTELSAVAAFVTVSVEVQRLETVLEAWDRNGDVGAVRADIHALAANVVTFKAASSFLRDKRITIVTVHQRDRDIAFTLIDFRRIDVVPVFIVLVGTDIFPTKDGIGRPTRGSDSSDNGGWSALYVADHKDVSQTSFAIMVDVWPAVFVQRHAHRIQGFSILLFTNGGDQAVYMQCYCFVGFNRTTTTFLIRFAKRHNAQG